jgi:hypothetical protein
MPALRDLDARMRKTFGGVTQIKSANLRKRLDK